eukprot:Selendium_serpulae@DN6477_c9_g4_i1.p1
MASGDSAPPFKHGDPTEAPNYRGITLLNILLKVFSRVIAIRLSEDLDDKLLCGFRRGRSTNDAIFSARTLMERARAERKDLHLTCVDLQKAYIKILSTNNL